jgi:hypothetical protein
MWRRERTHTDEFCTPKVETKKILDETSRPLCADEFPHLFFEIAVCSRSCVCAEVLREGTHIIFVLLSSFPLFLK